MSDKTWANGVHKFHGTPCVAESSAACADGHAISSASSESENMNKDQVKGTLKDAAGKVQETTGKVIGSTEQQVKGIKKQVAGQTQKAFGDLTEAVKDASHK